jgi:hypothetical protein
MNDEILAALNRIENASTQTAAKIGSAFWGAGVLLAAGMNYGRDGWDGILWSLLSWANVGYLLTMSVG